MGAAYHARDGRQRRVRVRLNLCADAFYTVFAVSTTLPRKCSSSFGLSVSIAAKATPRLLKISGRHEAKRYVRPPQGVAVGQIMVGVQIEFVGQGSSLPTVQGITGGCMTRVTQRPLKFIEGLVVNLQLIGK